MDIPGPIIMGVSPGAHDAHTAREHLIALYRERQERYIKTINDIFDSMENDPNHKSIIADLGVMSLLIDKEGEHARITFPAPTTPAGENFIEVWT